MSDVCETYIEQKPGYRHRARCLTHPRWSGEVHGSGECVDQFRAFDAAVADCHAHDPG